MCKYCEKGKSMCNSNTKDLGIELHSANSKLVAYGLDKQGWDISIECNINYCPMCRKEAGRVKHITLKEMLEEIVYCILEQKEIKDYYWKDGEKEFRRITEIDLLDRIRTSNDGFTEFEWELAESRLYKVE